MSEPDSSTTPEDVGTLTVEYDPEGTVDPADLAGTAGPQDDDGGYRPDNATADPEES